MKQLLATIVFAIAIFAGFTARAAEDMVQMVWTEEGKLTCRYQSVFQKTDKPVPYHFFNTAEDCLNSEIYRNLRKANGQSVPNKKENAKIAKYIKIFEDKVGIKIGETKIVLGHLKGRTLGVCSMKTRQIIIDRTFWESTRSELDKEMTIYHELGHCILNRAHYGGKAVMFNVGSEKKACPLSIMYKSSWSAKDTYRCFHQNRDYYFEELRGGSFLLKSQRNGKDSKILASWHLFNETFTFQVGPFVCTARRGLNITVPKNNSIFHIGSIKCTRDQVIFFEAWKIFRTAIGSNRIHNLMTKAQSRQSLTLILHDTLLNEKYRVYLMKSSPDLW